jgi:hypothetical protein
VPRSSATPRHGAESPESHAPRSSAQLMPWPRPPPWPMPNHGAESPESHVPRPSARPRRGAESPESRVPRSSAPPRPPPGAESPESLARKSCPFYCQSCGILILTRRQIDDFPVIPQRPLVPAVKPSVPSLHSTTVTASTFLPFHFSFLFSWLFSSQPRTMVLAYPPL